VIRTHDAAASEAASSAGQTRVDARTSCVLEESRAPTQEVDLLSRGET